MAGYDDGSLYPHCKVNEVLKNNKHFWKEPIQVKNWKNRYEVDFYHKNSIIKYTENHDSYYDLKYTASLGDNEINNCYADLCKYYTNTLYFVRPYSDAWKESKVRNANILKRNKF